MTTAGTDTIWRRPAERTRRALRLLGWDGPDCLPHEPTACGGTYLLHTVAHLAAIKACADHHLAHAGPAAGIADSIYASTLADVEEGCEQREQPHDCQ